MGALQCSERPFCGRLCPDACSLIHCTNYACESREGSRSFGVQYHTACLVQWNDHLRWTNVILHPGMMHTFVIFLGCIGTLLKASGMDILISTAFPGITSIVKEKAWTNALRSYRFIIAVLLQNLYSNSAKTYEEPTVYLETAREHPTLGGPLCQAYTVVAHVPVRRAEQ